MKKVSTKLYQSLSDIDHVLKRPEVYGGQTENEQKEYFLNHESIELAFPPMLYKILDEAIVNAADAFMRGLGTTKIKFSITDTGEVTIRNNGQGVPVEKHSNGLWTPEMVFFRLRAGQNFEDGKGREVGGKNGYGIKLAAIFSTSFTVDTVDKARGMRFTQTYTNNMKKAGKQKVKPCSKNDYTELKFQIDLAKFNVKTVPIPVILLVERRLKDIASISPKLNVEYDGEKLNIKTFNDYLQTQINPICSFESPKWKCAVGIGSGNLTFMNNVYTCDNGTHYYMFREHLYDKLMKKNEFKKKKIEKYKLFNKLNLVIFTSQADPTFNSQMKDRCTLSSFKYSNKLNIPDTFVNKLMKDESFKALLKEIYDSMQRKLDKKQDGKLSKYINVSKCQDAIRAGTKDSNRCTLILTEGDSALRLAQAGLSVVGNGYYGCYPLKGKILNGYKCSPQEWRKNAQISDIIQILGLKTTTKDVSKLRYHHVLVMADQDTDGYHIRGLVMALFGSHYPELLSIKGFIQIMKTPLVKAFSGDWVAAEFFDQKTAETYRLSHPRFRYKYYKGLGTSTSAEGKVYFKNLKNYVFDMSGSKIWLDQAFGDEEKHKRFRKDLSKKTPELLDGRTFEKYVKGPFNQFVLDSNIRAIPSVIDGLKPSQRKVLWTCIKKVSKEIRISSLAGLVTTFTHYHHGEASICQTAIKMAQDHVGSNNINLLKPKGQFGTRHSNGKDAAAPRYIFTECMPIVKLLFPPDDYPVYEYTNVDGHVAEPKLMVPIIPLLLVNGSMGMGTGWSTAIPSHGIRDVINNTKRYIREDFFQVMTPSVKGFKGTIEDNKYVGKYYKEDGIFIVTELPPNVETISFKEKLIKLKAKVTEHHTDTQVKFEVQNVEEKQLQKLLTSNIKNVWYAYHNSVVPVDQKSIFVTHGIERHQLYQKRKEHKIKTLMNEHNDILLKVKFIQDVRCNKINLNDPNVELVMVQLKHDVKLLDMPIRKLGETNKLQAKLNDILQEIQLVTNTSISEMWCKELDELEKCLYSKKRSAN